EDGRRECDEGAALSSEDHQSEYPRRNRTKDRRPTHASEIRLPSEVWPKSVHRRANCRPERCRVEQSNDCLLICVPPLSERSTFGHVREVWLLLQVRGLWRKHADQGWLRQAWPQRTYPQGRIKVLSRVWALWSFCADLHQCELMHRVS